MMVSFSGIDCSGKSTQIEKLSAFLCRQGIKNEVIWSRGGYTPGIELLKNLIRGKKRENKEETIQYSNQINDNPYKRKMLFIIGLIDLWRYYSIDLRIKEFFGTVVICDRYIWDTYIDYKIKYPDYSFENGFWWKLTMKTMLKPSSSFCLYIPAEVSMYRSTLKEEPFPESVEVRRQRIALYEQQIDIDRWEHVIDATASVEEVFQNIVMNYK